jgi:hypothetical protein
MACKCLNETKDHIMTMVAEKNPEWDIKSSVFTNSAFFFTQGFSGFYNPLEIEYEIATKKGGVRTKKETLNINNNFCPFCGVKYFPDEKDKENEPAG